METMMRGYNERLVAHQIAVTDALGKYPADVEAFVMQHFDTALYPLPWLEQIADALAGFRPLAPRGEMDAALLAIIRRPLEIGASYDAPGERVGVRRHAKDCRAALAALDSWGQGQPLRDRAAAVADSLAAAVIAFRSGATSPELLASVAEAESKRLVDVLTLESATKRDAVYPQVTDTGTRSTREEKLSPSPQPEADHP